MTARLILTAILAALLAACASLPPIRGKVCYTGDAGEVCLGGDAQAIVIEGAVHDPRDPVRGGAPSETP